MFVCVVIFHVDTDILFGIDFIVFVPVDCFFLYVYNWATLKLSLYNKPTCFELNIVWMDAAFFMNTFLNFKTEKRFYSCFV